MTAMWVIYVMQTCLDEFDWQYERSNILFSFWMTTLFWPISLIFNPRVFLDPAKMFNFDIVIGDSTIKGFAERARSLHQLAKSPPPCASTIYYSYKYVYNEADTGTRLWFSCDDIVEHFKGKTLPFSDQGQAVAMVAWIKNRDDSLEMPTEVPEQINFDNMAFALIEAGYGTVDCEECGVHYSARELSNNVPPIHAGWNTENYSCPKGHELLKHEYMHVNMRPRKS